MKLSEYISKTGDEPSAQLFCVAARTAASWRRKERCPKPPKARQIEQATKGLVTFAECFEVADPSSEYPLAVSEVTVENHR